jgi:hypothetical protein
LIVINPETGKAHTLYAADAEKLTEMKSCPVCHICVCRDITIMQNYYNYRNHVKHCEGKKPKRLVTSDSIPFAPRINSNKTYSHLLARNRLAEFKSTRYYECFDGETMNNFA